MMPVGHELADQAATLIHARQTILPKRLEAPGPDAAQLAMILGAAAAAPDHGQLLPWRFIIVPAHARAALGEVFATALRERDASASVDQLAQARDKAMRAPVLAMLVVDGGRGDANIDLYERIVSAGCALQNMLLMATALGFGSALTSGKAMKSQALRERFSLGKHDHAICFISLGGARARKEPKPRPGMAAYVFTFDPQLGVLPGLPVQPNPKA